MVRKVEIKDAETGKILREAYVQEENKIFGFSVSDFIKGGFLIVSISVFLINSDTNQKAMLKTVDRLVTFRDNVDSFQTTVYGTRFRDGEPVDSNFKIPNKGFIGKGE